MNVGAQHAKDALQQVRALFPAWRGWSGAGERSRPPTSCSSISGPWHDAKGPKSSLLTPRIDGDCSGYRWRAQIRATELRILYTASCADSWSPWRVPGPCAAEGSQRCVHCPASLKTDPSPLHRACADQ